MTEDAKRKRGEFNEEDERRYQGKSIPFKQVVYGFLDRD